MPIQIDEQANKAMEGTLKGSGGVRLPFDAPYIRFRNGAPALKELGGVKYFGGWEIASPEDYEALVARYSAALSYFTKSTVSSKDGHDYEAYLSRHIVVAPIEMRQAWYDTNTKQFKPHYMQGLQRKLQVLCYAATLKDKVPEPWGPVVLTVTGFQARNLLDAFATWENATKNARKKIAPNARASYFWTVLGTFGDAIEIQTVGKGEKKNTITPIHVRIPQDIEGTLEALFVGNGTLAVMAAHLEEAKEWLAARKEESMDVQAEVGDAESA